MADPLGRLYHVASPSGTRRFVYDGLDLIGEYDGSNNSVANYVFDPGTDLPIVVHALPQPDFLATDERGSIVALTADVTGALVGINTYDEFGKPGTSNIGAFQYTGQRWIPELGLYYYKARFYAPHLGRFMQTDPIGYEGGPNLYSYVGQDPVNSVDPLGFEEEAIVITGTRLPKPPTDLPSSTSQEAVSIAALSPGNADSGEIFVTGSRLAGSDPRDYSGPGALLHWWWDQVRAPIDRKLQQIPSICNSDISGSKVADSAKKGVRSGSVRGAVLGAVIGEVADPWGGGLTGAYLGAHRGMVTGAAGGAASSVVGQACSG